MNQIVMFLLVGLVVVGGGDGDGVGIGGEYSVVHDTTGSSSDVSSKHSTHIHFSWLGFLLSRWSCTHFIFHCIFDPQWAVGLFDSGAVGVCTPVRPYVLSLERGYWFGYLCCVRWYPG